MGQAPVFYFDYSPPYAYLAAMRIGDLLPCAIWRPIAFGALIRQIGKVPWSLGVPTLAVGDELFWGDDRLEAAAAAAAPT
jgi:2-hydroxychromene-2-carboxylate isomerase